MIPKTLAIAVVAVSGLIAATTFSMCGSPTVARPEGLLARPGIEGALRYRDEVFNDATTTKDIEYGTALDLENRPVRLTLDLYEPAGDRATMRPAVIWVHGGGYFGGDKSRGPAAELSDTFARLGYVSMSINYRLLAPAPCTAARKVSPECFVAGVEAVRDAQAAVRWLRANAATYRIDPDRIGIGGESAGAITATGVGLAADESSEGSNPGYSSGVGAWVSISGGVPEGIFVDASDAPGYLFSGTRDRTVPHRWSAETADAMEQAGVPVLFQPIAGAGHVPTGAYFAQLFDEQSRYFFYEYLRLDEAER